MSDAESPLEGLIACAPPFLPIFGAAAAGGYFGYCHAQGAPIDHAAWYLAGIPVGSAFLFSAMRREDNEMGIIGELFRRVAVVGSAVIGPAAYGIGYAAGRLM